MRNLVHLLVFLPVLLVFAAIEPNDMVIIILSERDGYSADQADLLKQNITHQAYHLQKEAPNFLLTHEGIGKNEIKGAWTIYPLIPIFYSKYPNTRWHLFCSENTMVNLGRLMIVLSRFNSSEEVWIGHGLHDTEPTIIHHYADPSMGVSYPNIASGFVISRALIKTLKMRVHSGAISANDFVIDAPYEFSNYVFNRGKGSQLIHSSEFCIVPTEDCATYPKKNPSCGNTMSLENILFAVKTYDENHSKRVPILMKTWLGRTVHYALFSNAKDEKLKNIVVVSHTTQGHCAKTYGLLQRAEKIMTKKKIKWLVVTDDDTILSVSRLSKILSCYDAEQPIAIGERYGFRPTEEIGYEYLTGGAGLAMSLPLIIKILKSTVCHCPMMTTPDDMFLFGICLSQLGVRLSPSPLFHQARPQDYAEGLLASQEPVSFHKFWMNDPVGVYRDWFKETDDKLVPVYHHLEL
ncbi:beta-1,3-glucosyltransferase [Diachasmimorpha longicaudata]|uniref:beta-1,3-glucosyltransferase n=1 Tax=Diachasmimorpha longicaudata TaxID=58733 RepID=UPI0030B90759